MNSWTHIQLRHLRCVVAVAQEKSLRKAADQLSITVPAVSKTLSELEDIVGQHLVRRLHSGAQLTPAGDVFCQFAVASLKNVREAWDAVDVSGPLNALPIRIGALPNVVTTVLPRAVSALLQDLPHTRIDVYSGTNAELLSRLTGNHLDMVVGRMGDPAQMVGLTFEHLYSEPLVFACRPEHPLLRQEGDLLEALQDVHVMLPLGGTTIRDYAENFFAKRGRALPRLRIESVSATFATNLLPQSDVVWFGPWGVIEPEVENQLLALLPIDTEDSLGPVGLTLRRDEQVSQVGQEFLRQLRVVAAARREDPWRAPLRMGLRATLNKPS